MEIASSSTPPKKMSPTPHDGIEAELSKLGNNLVTKFHVLMRISQIYDSKNVALNQFINEFLETINTLIKGTEVLSLKIIKDDFFLNDQRLRYSVEGFTSFKYLSTQWKKRLIGEVIFKTQMGEEMLRHFIYAFINLEEGREENADLLKKQLENHQITSIDVNPLEIVEGEEEAFTLQKEDHREVGKRIFF